MKRNNHHVEILTYGFLPEAFETEGKFLQLRLRGTEYLLFATRDLHRFHNQILAQFLEQNEIEFEWIAESALEVESPELQVIGGGRFRLHAADHTLTLWDNSQAYGRFDERGLKEKIASAESPWKTFSITISK